MTIMVVLVVLGVLPAQQRSATQLAALPEFQISTEEVKSELYFLASDYLKGRDTGSPELQIAANYLAEHLRAFGFKPAPGMDSYFQTISFSRTTPPETASLQINKTDYTYKDEFLLLSGDATRISKADAVFAGHGWVDPTSGHDDYQGLDVKGKVVLVLPGPPNEESPQAVFQAMGKKQQLAAERGAVALIELYRLSFPWNFFVRYFGQPSLRMDEGGMADGQLVYGWMKENNEASDIKDLQNGKRTRVNLTTSGYRREAMPSDNVVGVLEGTDPVLKNEYILLSAHYDHVGVGAAGSNATTEEDNIFNGARDNGMGTVALLNAAKAFAAAPPKRSVVVLFCTAEEKGLLGSRYFADHSPVPLDKVIFNLNTDGAGYNSTEHVAVIGYGRTGTDAHIDAAAAAAGLKVVENPAAEQGLFDRSDNVSFAVKGIPCMTFSPGLTAFDAAINKYYHQVADNPESVDYDYMLKYVQSYAYLARLIADDANKPTWQEGDKYYEAGKALYKN